jgi:gluconate 2-dehydrogenase gamma chain
MGAYDRRSILLGGVGLGAVGVAGGLACEKPKPDEPAAQPVELDAPQGGGEMGIAEIIPVLVAVADRLIPPDAHGPGAKDAGAQRYFEWVLADPRMKNIKSIVTRGAVWVNRAARKENNVAFFDLEPARQDELITRLAENKVRPSGFTPNAFVRVMLALTLESYLGDPKYGGNKDQLGWKTVGGIDWSGRKQPALPVLPIEKDGGAK